MVYKCTMYTKCIEKSMCNPAIIQALASNSDYTITQKFLAIQSIVENNAFWDRASIIVKLLEPIDNSIGQCEKDNSDLSTVYEQFEILYNADIYKEKLSLNDPDETLEINKLQNFILSNINERRFDLISSSVRAACFLNPSVNPSIFRIVNGVDEARTAMRNIIDLASRHIVGDNEKNLFQSRIQSELEQWHIARLNEKFYIDSFYLNSTPSNYWKFERNFALIQPFALKLYSSVASSAASERSWSIHEFLHSKRRNRLSVQSVEMLVFIYSNLKYLLKDGVELFDYILGDTYPDTFGKEIVCEENDEEDINNVVIPVVFIS